MMKCYVMMILSAAVAGSCFAVEKPTPGDVKAVTKKVADWQMETFEDQVKYRAVASDKREKLERARKDPEFKPDWYTLTFAKNGTTWNGTTPRFMRA